MKFNRLLNRNRKLVTAALLTGTLAIVNLGGTAKTTAQIHPNGLSQTVNQNAVWTPGANTVQTIRQQCDNQGVEFIACFVNGMQRAGASPAAIAFTRSIDNMGYIQTYRPIGKVSVAAVILPFMANENQALYLVNGSPARINVDDQTLLNQNALDANPIYAQLVQKYTDILMVPGDRSLNAMTAETLPNGGQRFLVNYRLNDRCHACPQVGTAQFAFNFDAAGEFQGATLMNVIATPNPAQ